MRERYTQQRSVKRNYEDLITMNENLGQNLARLNIIDLENDLELPPAAFSSCIWLILPGPVSFFGLCSSLCKLDCR